MVVTAPITEPTRPEPPGRRTIAVDGYFDGELEHGPSTIYLNHGVIERISEGIDAATGAVRARYAMPGLIDAHVHVTGYREGIPAGQPYEPMKQFLRLCVASGVTTVRDTGNSIETIAYVKRWGERYDGPRVVASGPLLDTPPFMWAFSRYVAEPADAVHEVDRLAYEGVDFIKLYRNLDGACIATAIAEAHARGLKVAGDLQRTRVVDAVRAGLDSVEHAITMLSSLLPHDADGCGCTTDSASFLTRYADVDPDGAPADDLSAAMLANGSVLVPTFLVSRRWAFFDEMVSEPNNPLMAAVMPYHQHFAHMRGAIGVRIGKRIAGRYMPIRVLDRHETKLVSSGFETMQRVVARLARDGVPVVVGTDSPNPSVVPGFAVHQEMALLAASGITNRDVLRAATSVAADLLAIDAGRLSPGRPADVVLLDGDPIRDLTATARITGVVMRGKTVDRNALLARVRDGAQDDS